MENKDKNKVSIIFLEEHISSNNFEILDNNKNQNSDVDRTINHTSMQYLVLMQKTEQ